MKTLALHFIKEIQNAGLEHVSMQWGCDGQIEFNPGNDPADEAAVMALYDAHNPDVNPFEVEEAIQAQGPSNQEVLEAIVAEKEGDPSKMQAVIQKRNAVRSKFS